MRILCPMCGFGREIDEAKIPPRAQMATCPRCQHKFRFRVVDDLAEPAPAPPAEAVKPGPGQDLSASTMDPLAAQRAAAAQAWKRIQGAPKPDQTGQQADQQPGGAPSDAQQAAPGAAPDVTPREEPPAAWPTPGTPGRTSSSVPFENLPSFGFFPGLWGTIRLALTKPAAFFRAMPVTGGMAKPLIFHLLLAEFMVLCQYFWGVSGIGFISQYTGSAELMDMGMGMAGASPALLFVFYPLLLILRLMIMTGVVHALLKLLRSAGGGPEGTFRVLCYSAAPLIAGVIPLLGPVIGGVWSIGLTIIGLKEAHRTRVSAVMFAVLVPIMLLLAAVLGLMQGVMKAG